MFGLGKKNKADGNWSYLGQEAVVRGQLCFRDSYAYFDGKIKGDIVSTGTLSARESAVIRGNVFVESLVLSGTVYGDIKASKTLLLTPGAKVFGNLYYGELTIEGATHEGSSHKLTEEENKQLIEYCEKEISSFEEAEEAEEGDDEPGPKKKDVLEEATDNSATNKTNKIEFSDL